MGFKALAIGALAAASIQAQLAFDPPVQYPIGSGARCVRTGDIDNDGELDVVVVHEIANDIRIFKNDGTGGFSFFAGFAPPNLGAATWVVLAPLHNAFDLDMVVTFRDSNWVGVFFNPGSGVGQPLLIPMPGGPVCATAVDLDNDSDLDLVVTNEVAGVVSVLPNNFNGTFGARVDTATGNWPVSVASGFFNGDGLPDLAVSHLIGGTVAILLNAGGPTGTFNVAGSMNTGFGSFGIVAANFDANPTPDLAVANYSAGTVAVFLGNGAGGFSAGPVIPVGSTPTSLFAADYDGDLLTDLAVSEFGAGTVSILRRTGPATFAAPIAIPAGIGPVNVAAADLDADGDLDLLSANHQGSSFSVIFRTLLGAHAFGNVGIGAGGPFNNLQVNGSSGGRDRHVTVGINQTFTLGITQPPTNGVPSDSSCSQRSGSRIRSWTRRRSPTPSEPRASVRARSSRPCRARSSQTAMGWPCAARRCSARTLLRGLRRSRFPSP